MIPETKDRGIFATNEDGSASPADYRRPRPEPPHAIVTGRRRGIRSGAFFL